MSEDTLFVVRIRHRPAARTLAAIVIAGAAIGVGVAFYAFARPQPVLFLPAGWHSPQAHALPAVLFGGLPTFVHALAMPLLIAALLQPRRRIDLVAVCAAWCGVEIAFELAQHPSIGHTLLASLPTGEHCSAWLAPFANFVRTGTFDWIDIAAAALASLIAYAASCHCIERHATPAETRHVQFA
jgi:hypothetical protein